MALPELVTEKKCYQHPVRDLNLVTQRIRGARVQLQARAMESLRKVIEECAKEKVNFVITYSYRSCKLQAELYAESHQGTLWACAAPGHSLHNIGLAVDTASKSQHNLEVMRRVFGKHGWHQFSTSADPWHFSFSLVG